MDWWLSPEMYLRRPPSANEKYRLDNMLKAAAERGVKVNVVVYKEVEAALTRKWLLSDSSISRRAMTDVCSRC
jgi:phospholipase D1/2